MSSNCSLSTPASAAGCISGLIEAAGPRSASRTADQKRCASCSSRSTDTNATRRTFIKVERSAQARNSEVFPLPAGAETTVIRLVTARSSVWRSTSRSSRPRATENSLEIGCSRCPSPSRRVVDELIMLCPRSGPFNEVSIPALAPSLFIPASGLMRMVSARWPNKPGL